MYGFLSPLRWIHFCSPQNEEISNAEDLMQLGCLSSSKLLSEGNFDQSNMEDASWKARLLSIEGGDSSKALKATNSLIKMSQQAISLGNLNFGQSLLDKAKLTANLSDSKIQGRLAISEAQVSLALGIKSNAKEKILSFLQTNFEGNLLAFSKLGLWIWAPVVIWIFAKKCANLSSTNWNLQGYFIGS